MPKLPGINQRDAVRVFEKLGYHIARQSCWIIRLPAITLLSSDEKVQWSQADDALTVKAQKKMPNDIAIVFKISL